MRRNPDNDRRGGFTLVEMLVVVAIIGIMSAAIVGEMHGTFQDALLRATGRELAGAFNAASSRAVSINRPHRILIDTVAHRYFLARGRRSGGDFQPAEDVPGSSGTLDSRITIRILEPGLEDEGNAGDSAATAREEGVTFYPDGTADARQIELADRDGFRLALRVDPITSRVRISGTEHP